MTKESAICLMIIHLIAHDSRTDVNGSSAVINISGIYKHTKNQQMVVNSHNDQLNVNNNADFITLPPRTN